MLFFIKFCVISRRSHLHYFITFFSTNYFSSRSYILLVCSLWKVWLALKSLACELGLSEVQAKSNLNLTELPVSSNSNSDSLDVNWTSCELKVRARGFSTILEKILFSSKIFVISTIFHFLGIAKTTAGHFFKNERFQMTIGQNSSRKTYLARIFFPNNVHIGHFYIQNSLCASSYHPLQGFFIPRLYPLGIQRLVFRL